MTRSAYIEIYIYIVYSDQTDLPAALQIRDVLHVLTLSLIQTLSDASAADGFLKT